MMGRLRSEMCEKVLRYLQKILPSAVPHSASTSGNNPHSSHLKKMRARASAELLLDSDLLNQKVLLKGTCQRSNISRSEPGKIKLFCLCQEERSGVRIPEIIFALERLSLPAILCKVSSVYFLQILQKRISKHVRQSSKHVTELMHPGFAKPIKQSNQGHS